MIGHLGTKVSALLDGQLPPEEAERAWAHVHVCHSCRDAVEREGWVKTRLAGLSSGPHGASEHLKGSLLFGATLAAAPAGHDRPRRAAMLLLVGSAASVAVLGVVALGLRTLDQPTPARDVPPANVPSLRTATPSPSG